MKDTRSYNRKYREAAVAYLVYGIIYLVGALYLAYSGEAARAMAPGSFWWFVLGAAMVVLFPILIWKEFKWVTRALAVLVFVRVIGLVRVMVEDGSDMIAAPWGGEMPKIIGAAVFLIVAAATCFMLVRAGWNLPAWASWSKRSPGD